MRLIGLLLLVSGWGLVMAALVMLATPGPRGAFILAGVAVEILGLVMTVRAHLPPKNGKRSREMDREDGIADSRESVR
jgi:hypothetical protein